MPRIFEYKQYSKIIGYSQYENGNIRYNENIEAIICGRYLIQKALRNFLFLGISDMQS